MSGMEDSERKLHRLIKVSRLRTSVSLIREAVGRIWSIEAPRIIRDYTDHSLNHSSRVAGFAAQIIQASTGKALSSEEAYLLLASIYLHDIGMQCDVVRWPAIRERAERMGAQFDPIPSARLASEYNLDEQTAVRKNHHLLSAAWIDHAARTGETVLGIAAKTIPSELVDDLMDVCKYHSKLPITECGTAFRYHPSGRKQLAASILRFADELDIDARRVSLETVQTFNLSPRNAAYWYLHNQTIISFPATSVVMLTLRLNPHDSERFREAVHNIFITEFVTKNRAVLTTLAQHGIPLVISDDSKVLEDDRVEVFPPDVHGLFLDSTASGDPAVELAEEVRIWLRALQYEVSTPKSSDGGQRADMIATLDLGSVRQRVLILCFGGEITKRDVVEASKLVSRRWPEAWLISDRRVSKSARALAGDEDLGVTVFALPEFLKRQVWDPYFNALAALVENEQIPSLYVQLGCHRYDHEIDEGAESGRSVYEDVEEYLDEWLAERGKAHISLLGDFGSGKTWLCRHYAYRQLDRYLKDPVHQRVPLLITLRSFAKAMRPDQLINDALLEQYKLPFVGSAFEVFKELNRRGKLLLILDGFDEMARQVDYQMVVDNFWELAKLVDENSKVILTSRTEYFRWAQESEKILSGKEFGRRTIFLSPPKFEVLYLEPFDTPRVREVIKRRIGGEAGLVLANRILSNKTLAEMASKPILIELLLAAMSEVSTDVLENPADVYLFATKKLLLRNITAEKTFTSTADKLYFLCELAWEMISSGSLRVHYAEIPRRIKAYFGGRIEDSYQLDTWDYDLRSQTLLHRNAAGYYEFAHKSLAEYFVALKFAAELGCLRPEFVTAYLSLDHEVADPPYTARGVVELASNFGRKRIDGFDMRAVQQLLVEMIDRDRTDVLWNLVQETTRHSGDAVEFVGGNIITLLCALREDFIGQKLRGANLSGAYFHDADLTSIDLRDTSLRDSCFVTCTLERADFRGADLSGVSVDELSGITQIDWDVASNRVICGTRHRRVHFWDIASASIEWSISARSKWVAFTFSPGSQLLAVGGGTNVLQLWNTETREVALEVDLGVESLNRVAINHSEEFLLASTGPNKYVQLWDLRTGSQSSSIKGDHFWNNVVDFHPTKNLFACGGRSGMLKFVEYPRARVMKEIEVDIAFVRGWFSKDGERFWAFGLSKKDKGDHGTARRIDPLMYIAQVDLQTFSVRVNEISTGIDQAADFDPQRERVVYIHGQRLYLHSLWPEVQLIGSAEIISITKEASMPVTVSFSTDGERIAVGGSRLLILPTASLEASSNSDAVILEARMRCNGMRLGKAKGLHTDVDTSESLETLLEFFHMRGAILDQRQLQELAELRAMQELAFDQVQPPATADTQRE